MVKRGEGRFSNNHINETLFHKTNLVRRQPMSHFTTIKTEIRDPDILKRTLSDLNFEFKENGKIPGYRGRMEEIDIAVGLAGDYYFGFKRNKKNGSYEIRGLVEYLQNSKVNMMIKEMLQEYAYRKVLQETRKRGFSLIQEERLSTGSIKLVLRKVA